MILLGVTGGFYSLKAIREVNIVLQYNNTEADSRE